MSSFSTMYLIATMFFICIETATSDIVRRQLTEHQVEFDFHNREDFPDILPVVIKSTDRIVNFSFTKKDVDFNVPVYMRSKDTNEFVLIETSPITNAALYEDQIYDASVTLHCKEHVLLRNSCNIQSLSGFFHLDGYKHVIEPEKIDSKSIILQAIRNHTNKFVQKHRVYKLAGHNHSCNVEQNQQSVKSIIKRAVNRRNNRFKRSKTQYTIEVMAVITQEHDEEEIKRTKIYYSHVFWGVNLLYNNINMNDMSIGVKLVGFIKEPINTTFYQFPKGTKKDYLNGTLTLKSLSNYDGPVKADHLVMFSIHNISDNPSTVGLANVGAMCKAGSVSLCRVLRSFEEIHVVAHEIGHSLDSLHDGEQNTCSASDNYIMTAKTAISPSTGQLLNAYKFSGCSIKAIKDYISNLNTNNCLLYNNTFYSWLIPSAPTGQLFTPMEQCRTSLASQGVCSSFYAKRNSDICLGIQCRVGDYCKTVTPAYKTTCGNQKWCIFGDCVFDENAPKADDNCLFGDAEVLKFNIRIGNVIYQPKNCSEIINLVKDFCTVPSQRTQCCYTCNQHEKSTTTSLPSSSMSVIPFWTTTTTTRNVANMKCQLFPIALAILHLFQPENIFAL